MFARPFIDSVDFARNGKQMRGEVAVSALSRLQDMLADQKGALNYTVRGYRDGDRDMLEVAVEGMLVLQCQRCLGELEFPVNLVSALQLLPADLLDELEDDGDEVDAIEAVSGLDVLALVEDELLLGVPFAPRHAEGECAPAANDVTKKTNPFSVLVGLKK